MRLGSIRYINSLPVDLALLTQKVLFSGEVVRGAPAELNLQILEGKIDAGPVSAFWYAQNQSKFFIFPDLSISSESGVQSVLLFSRGPVKGLAGKKIAVTGEGRTTPALLEILCRKFYGFTPQFESLASPFREIPSGAEGLLLIGDDALVHRARLEASGFTVTDLAEEWRQWTGLGFVFAVWVVRQDFAAQYPEETKKAHEAILLSKKWGLSHASEVLAAALRQTGLSQAALESYFSCLSYGLGPELVRGMNLYFQYAAECGLLAAAGPLVWADGNMDSPGNNRYNKAFIAEEK